MSRSPSSRSRLPLIGTTVAALIASAATAATASAAPTTPPRPAAFKSAHPNLKSLASRINTVPRVVANKAKPAAGEPGGVAPAGVPKSGSYAFLLQLSGSSTFSSYRSARAGGATTAAASTAAKQEFNRIKAAQAAVVAALPRGSQVLYRTHAALAGVAVRTDVRNVSALKAIAGVAAVLPIAPKRVSNSYAVPLQKADQVWQTYGDLGANSTIAVIDTGIDYTHANFGGPGSATDYQTALSTDASPANPAWFPTSKIIGGFDFAGDAYDASAPAGDPAATPVPDPNPLDCNSHGSHVAGTAAGFGVTSGGATFTGPYNTSTPFNSLRIGPGMAPAAKLYAYKVFGCAGSTNVVSEAIDRAMDPNNDGDPSDHVDVINMSLGSDFGSPQDADSVVSNSASAAGVSVVVASGNGGDLYDVGGSPGNAVRTIAVANSVDAYSQDDALTVSAPISIQGDYAAERSVAYAWGTVGHPDLAGPVVALSDPTNKDGCAALNGADAAAVNGKIAFLEWTDGPTRRCGSVARSGNVAAAHAIGFIFADDSETFAAGITGSTTIPGVMVAKSGGDAIRGALASGVTISGTSAGTFAQLVPGNDDMVNESSSRGIRGAGNVKPDVTAVGTSVFSTSMGTGNQGQSDTGTSMATPMVAGLAALVRSQHSDWTPEEVKADIMNTAGQDLFTGQGHTGDKYAPNRVGSGRIDAKAALDNSVLAYVTNDPGAVSASFGTIEATTAAITLTKTIKVVNTSLESASYNVGYEAITTVPGVNYTVSAPSVTLDPRSSKTVTLTLSIPNPALLTKTRDVTTAADWAGTSPALPREFLADASGRVVFTPVSGTAPTLRVPVYSAPRPASVMGQAASLTLPVGNVQTAALKVTGHNVNQGVGTQLVQSKVSGFELQATSGLAPTCTVTKISGCVHFADERAADVKYVAAASDAPVITALGGTSTDVLSSGTAYFAVTAQGRWRSPVGAQEFDVLIDTNNDGVSDFVLYNTRLVDGQDIFVSVLFDLNHGTIADVEPINFRFGDVDTALFDSDTMVLPAALFALGITSINQRIRYGVASFGPVSADPVDMIGLNANFDVPHGMSFAPARPGLAIYGAPALPQTLLFNDVNNGLLTVRRDRAVYASDHALGALLVHYQNRVGTKAQVVAIKSKSAVGMRLSASRVLHGTAVTATIGVASTAGPVATGAVTLGWTGPVRQTTRLGLRNGATAVRLVFTRPGTYRIAVSYPGDLDYLSGVSPTLTLVVT